jgi:ABC-2 type transport system ATP-binding protein
VPSGSVTALVGSNGAGKTSLLKILATLLLPSSGEARVAGLDVVRQAAAVRARIGFVPSEDRSFHWRLTVAQNLDFFAALHGVGRKEWRRRLAPHLEALGLSSREGTPFGHLSTGMKQCLGILRGLAHGPAVVLLDEPTRSLSPDLVQAAGELLRAEAHGQGRGVLLATHNLLEAQAVADRFLILHQGRIQASGTHQDLWAGAGMAGEPALEPLFRVLTGAAPAPGGEGEARP